MDKVPTPPQIPQKMQERTAQAEEHLQTLDVQIAEKRRTMEQLELDITSLRSSEYSKEIAKERTGRKHRPQGTRRPATRACRNL